MQHGKSICLSGGLRLAVMAFSAAGLFAITTGCGAVNGITAVAGERAVAGDPCDRAPSPDEAGTLVVLDWDGGESYMPGAGDLAAFDVDHLGITDVFSDHDSLSAAYREAVLARVQAMLCRLDPLDVAVIEGDSEDYPQATIVHITADAPAGGGMHIGQSDYDMCNDDPDDSAIVWVGVLVRHVSNATFTEWVNIVANTTTHEIGHTLGFTHPTEESVGRMLPIPEEEVMRANVTVAQLKTEQNFIIEQDTCPAVASGEYSYSLLSGVDAN